MIGLVRIKFQCRGNILGLKIRVVFKYLFTRRTSCQRIQDILHANSEAPYTWSPPTLIGLHYNTMWLVHFFIVGVLAPSQPKS